MNKNKTNTLVTAIIILLAIVIGAAGYMMYSINKTVTPTNTNTTSTTTPSTPITNVPVTTTANSVTYNNTDLGFNFALPDNWKGYTIINNTWKGNPLTANRNKESGAKLLIRNPKWTSSVPYEDIPILVFTLKQWGSYVAEDFSVSAAPIKATELGRNNVYVFALPPRWDFDYSKDFEEAQNIIKSNPLKAYNLQNNGSAKLNIDVVCKSALAYTTFQDSVSADKFVSDCKEGKHPEIIERYIKEMGIKNGAVI